MPNRWISSGIVLFWLIMMGWLVGRETWQRYGARPKLQETLAASAAAGPVHWTILQEEKPLGQATTEIKFSPQIGQYELIQNLHLRRILGLTMGLAPELSLRVDSRTIVNLFGDLQSFFVQVRVPEVQLQCTVKGTPVEGSRLVMAVTILLNNAKWKEEEYQLAYDGKDLLLNSLCPLDRMPAVQPGQQWETPLVDPLSSAFTLHPMAGTIDRSPVKVKVLSEPQGLVWGGDYVSCWVVDSKRGDLHVQIWVRQSDGLVLKQTMHWGSTSLEVVRVASSPGSGER
jgi:hypothetical protein